MITRKFLAILIEEIGGLPGDELVANPLYCISKPGAPASARVLLADATSCLKWMEEGGIESCQNVGPFRSLHLGADQKVRVIKGSTVRSTNPSYNGEPRPIGRTTTVTAKRVDNGWVDRTQHPESVRQAQVRWNGTGGYWYWTDLNNIEII